MLSHKGFALKGLIEFLKINKKKDYLPGTSLTAKPIKYERPWLLGIKIVAMRDSAAKLVQGMQSEGPASKERGVFREEPLRGQQCERYCSRPVD